MNLNNEDEASFFKILLRDSIDYCPLPPAFAKKYMEESSTKNQTIVLKTKSAGIKWSVKYMKIEDKYCFTDGWLKFMNDNRLQMGDFLVFWLLSSSNSSKPIFQVYLYAPNGCLKHPTTSHDQAAVSSNGKKPLIEEEISDDDDSFENKQISFKKVVWKTYSHRMVMKYSFVKATGIDGYDSVQLRNDKGKTWNVMIKKYGLQHQIRRMQVGWFDFRNCNNIKIGDTCEFSHVKSNMIHVRVLKKKGRYFK